MADKKSLEGQFQKLMRAGTYGDNTYSPSDLNEVVSNFDPGPGGIGKIPVHFGMSGGAGPIVAKVSELSRDGDTLSGKVTEVDPRLDQLFKTGKLSPRRSFTVKRTPKGLSLASVGIHPPRVFSHDIWEDGPASDSDLTKLAASGGSREPAAVVTFSEGSGRGHSAQHQGETWRFQTNSERLSELATQRAREDKTLSFGEALSQVAAENPRLTLPDGVISLAEETPKSNGQKLSDLAYERARQDKINFCEALSQVAAEHPELTLPDAR